jgi:hypothetical protein
MIIISNWGAGLIVERKAKSIAEDKTKGIVTVNKKNRDCDTINLIKNSALKKKREFSIK